MIPALKYQSTVRECVHSISHACVLGTEGTVHKMIKTGSLRPQQNAMKTDSGVTGHGSSEYFSIGMGQTDRPFSPV